MAEFSKVLDVAGVSKRFGDVEVLSDVSFQVDKGETICVLGPSGSGKSTLLRCINWLERPDAGQIYLNGERVGINNAGTVMGDRDLSKIRTRIGMVFQHFALWPHLTVLQNLMEAPVQVQRRPKAERGELSAIPRRKAGASLSSVTLVTSPTAGAENNYEEDVQHAYDLSPFARCRETGRALQPCGRGGRVCFRDGTTRNRSG